MRVFDEHKTKELSTYDLSKGFLVPDRIVVECPPANENAEEHDVDESVLVYIEFLPTLKKEFVERALIELKSRLKRTDYEAIKYAEGALSESEYAEMKAQREEWRKRINELEIVTGE